jgi:ligand-binding sensor domain-containing protein/anti-sigma regulatory factor (Ser/Thr protein kinase)
VRKHCLYVIIIGVWFTCMNQVMGQSFPQLRFQRITEKDGLSDNSITSIVQDRDGIIWVGTPSGLNRFDGSKIKKFLPSIRDTNSVLGGAISTLLVDAYNNIWASTTDGIAFLNTKTQQFTRFRHKDYDSTSFRIVDKPCIFLGKNNLPWVATKDAVYRFQDSIHYSRITTGAKPFEFYNEQFDHYIDMYAGNSGQLWGASINRIYFIDSLTGKVIWEKTLPFITGIRKMHIARSGLIWITTWGDGLFIFDPSTQQCNKVNIGNTNPFLSGLTEWIYNGEKYIAASAGNKLLLVNEKDLSWYVYTPGDIGNRLEVSYVYVDRKEILWLGTSQGLFFVSASNLLFDILPILSPENTSPDNVSFVYNLVETGDSYWFTKRYNDGIYCYSKNWKLKKFWSNLVPPSKNKFGSISSTTEGYDFRQVGNEMFISTESGMVVMDLSNYSTKLYYTDLEIPPRLRTIVPESDTAWWVRSFTNGVFVFNPVKKIFTRRYTLNTGRSDAPETRMNYLLRTSRGILFAATEGGLFSYDRTKDEFKKVINSKMDSLNLLSTSLMGMTEDSSGWVWIGTNMGAVAFDPGNGKIVKVFTDNPDVGLVLRLCTDNKQNLWFNSLTTGYWCWLRDINKLVSFGYNLGLPWNDESTFASTSDGAVYGGGANAITRFYPDRLLKYRNVPGIKILEASVNGVFTPFTHSAPGNTQMVMKPGMQNITVDFAVINYDLLSNNRYYYRLLPGNKEWQETEDGHLVFYNLPTGRYELEVRGSNTLSGSFSATDTIYLTVLPYWYQTSWFKLLSILVIAALALFIIWRRINVIKKEAAFKQKIAETQMQALRAQMNPHFIFNSLNSIENFIMQNEKRQASDYLNKFSRLIRNILDSSMNELVPLSRDMEALQLYIDLEQLRFNNKFTYKVQVEPSLLHGDYRVPSLLIQPYVENAVVHGLANSNRDDLYFAVSILLEGDHIKYIIEDNGIGREKSSEYRRYNKPHHKSVGLKISEDRIVMYNQTQRINGHAVITDLFDRNGIASGTRVEIRIRAN